MTDSRLHGILRGRRDVADSRPHGILRGRRT